MAVTEARIYGRVTKVVGDYMGPNKKPKFGYALSAIPVHIFKGKIYPFETLNQRPDLSLLYTLYTDSDGEFDCIVPEGTYTVVAEIKGKMYLNIYTETGHWWHVTVRDGEGIKFDIVDVSEATF